MIQSPLPSAKIQIIGRKVSLRCKGKTLLGVVNKLIVFKSLLTTPSNVLPLHFKQTLQTKLEFSFKMKVMRSNPGYLLKSFSLYLKRQFKQLPFNRNLCPRSQFGLELRDDLFRLLNVMLLHFFLLLKC